MSATQKLVDAFGVINEESVSVKLYIITRHIKDGLKKTTKAIDKYKFLAHTVDLSSDLNEFFVGVAKKQLDRMIQDDDYELEEYAVIGDDLENKIYTYELNNALSFSDVISNQMLTGECSTLSSLRVIKDDLWAYSIRFNHGDILCMLLERHPRGRWQLMNQEQH